MPRNTTSLNRELFDMLTSRGYEPTVLSADGKEVPVPEQGEVFQFHFHKDTVDYGTVTVSIDGLRELVVYYGDEIAKSKKDSKGDDSWYDFLAKLKKFSTRHQLGFKLSNMDKLKHDMAKRIYSKKVNESYHPAGSKKSWADNVPTVKIHIQHSRNMEEGEQRYRAIDKIFVENTDGEKFLLPTKSPSIARAFARHVAEGGNTYDEQGEHIKQLAEEFSKVNAFCRATKSGKYLPEQQAVIDGTTDYRQKIVEALRKIASKRGYNDYFNDPFEFTDCEVDENLFETEDQRILDALPIVSRFRPKQRVNELEQWADNLVQETLYPSTGADVDKLVELIGDESEPLPVGADAMNALNMLVDLVDDETLHNRLRSLAKRSPKADARDTIKNWIQEQSHPTLQRVAQRLNHDVDSNS